MDGIAFDERRRRKLAAQKAAEDRGDVADSMAVRVKLIERMHAGELTLDQVKAEIDRLKRGARKAGKITRNQAYVLG